MKIAGTLPAPWARQGLQGRAGPERRPEPVARLSRTQRDRRYELALALRAPEPRRGRLLDVEA